MNPPLFIDVDPRTLHLPTSRLSGADPFKLHRQMAQFGSAVHGMPTLEVYRGTDGKLVIYKWCHPRNARRQAIAWEIGAGGNHRRHSDAGRTFAHYSGHLTMTTNREELLRLLGELSEHAPELRLGQLVANLATLAKGAQVEAIWDAEDDELLPAARRLIDHYRGRQARAAS